MELCPAESDAKPVSWIASKLAELWGNGASWNQDANEHPKEAHYLKLDVSRAKEVLNWQPVLPLADALEWIVQWYRAFQSEGDLLEVTQRQISRYADRLL